MASPPIMIITSDIYRELALGQSNAEPPGLRAVGIQDTSSSSGDKLLRPGVLDQPHSE